MTMTKQRAKADEQLVFTLPPDVFARAWGNLRAVTKLGDLGTWWLEHYDGAGAWLIASGGGIIFAAWVAEDPGLLHRLPDLRREPDHVVCFRDPDGRLEDLCKRLAKTYNAKDALAPDFSDYLQVRPGTLVDGRQLAFDAMGSVSYLSVWSSGERHDLEGLDIPAVQWRHIVRTHDVATRDNLIIDPAAMKVLAQLRGMKPPRLRFGLGSNAIAHIAPDVGGWPHILAVLNIGERRDDVEPTEPAEEAPNTEVAVMPALRNQHYDVETGSYLDDVNGDDGWDS